MWSGFIHTLFLNHLCHLYDIFRLQTSKDTAYKFSCSNKHKDSQYEKHNGINLIVQ